MKHILFPKALIIFLVQIYAVCADAPNPIYWERSFIINSTSTGNVGTLIQNTSAMATSQDFQGIHLDANLKNSPDRVVFNFADSCISSNMTIDTLRQLNTNGFDIPAISNLQKIALVKRGNCSWGEKISVVNSLATANNISITAVFIYDNNTYGNNITVERTLVTGSGSVSPPIFATSLPISRSVLNMTDNDISMGSPSTTTVFFIPNVYGMTLINRLNTVYDPTNPTMKTYWLITPYFEQVSWGYSSSDSFFSTGRGYLSYIIALAAIFLLGIIFLRWWRMRRMSLNHAEGQGFGGSNGIRMQNRNNQLDPLPVDIVNSLPIEIYTEGLVKNVNCAICLEDFVVGKNDIRILPCGHGFCVLCIDPWLTQKSTMCPICKWDCLPSNLREERNAAQQQQQQQQQNGEQPSPETVINMGASGPSNTASPEVQQVVNAQDENTSNNICNSAAIVPPSMTLSASPPPYHDCTIDAKQKNLADNNDLSGSNETPYNHTNKPSAFAITTSEPDISALEEGSEKEHNSFEDAASNPTENPNSTDLPSHVANESPKETKE